MAQKVKPRTGAAVSQDEEDDSQDPSQQQQQPQQAISDAQATDLPTSASGVSPGFTAPLAPPGGPSMGGDLTKGNEFAAEVARATNVPSKGGPPASELSAASGKGAIKEGLRRPQDTDRTTRAPEEQAPPRPPGTAFGSEMPIVPNITPGTPVTEQQGVAQQAGQGGQGGQPSGQAAQPESQLPPAFQNHGARIELHAKSEWGDYPQDYSQVDPYVTNDPNFAGLASNGRPLFMDAEDKVYFRDETEPGKEIRHYALAPYGSEAATKGVVVTDPDKMDAAKNGREEMQGMLQTQAAINQWKEMLFKYQATHGDEGWLQRLAVEAKMSGDKGLMGSITKALAGTIVNPDEEDLDTARSEIALPFAEAGGEKATPGRVAFRFAESQMPQANDDFGTQLAKVQAMERKIQQQAVSLRTAYPFASQHTDQLLRMIGSGQSPGARPAAKDITGDKAAYDSLPKGAPYIWNGKPYTKQ